MKINRINIKNYKSMVESGNIFVDEQIMALIGQNNTGKSTILDAIQCVFPEAKKNVEYKDFHNRSKNVEIELEFSLVTGEYLKERLCSEDFRKKENSLNEACEKGASPDEIAELLKKFDVNICLCAPEYFYDQQLSEMEWESNLNKALENADVVMALRVQKERLENEFPILDYMKKYRLDVNNFPQNAILLHPGPVNRDIEVSSKLLSTEKGRTILEQAKNGVYVRMAILDLILGTR